MRRLHTHNFTREEVGPYDPDGPDDPDDPDGPDDPDDPDGPREEVAHS